MNSLLENKGLTELHGDSNFSYVLNDNEQFSFTEYRVLQNQSNSCFVKCMKMLFNGKIQMYYLTEGFKSFAALLPGLDAESFLTIASNLLANIIEVKNNGFLSCENIDISFDHIYVDTTTYKVGLVYCPLKKKLYDNYFAFENEVRTSFVRLIDQREALTTQKNMRFSQDLANGTLSLEDISGRIKNGISEPHIAGQPKHDPVRTSEMYLVAINTDIKTEIRITKDEFVVGKNAMMADGVVSFNRMISRKHCKINRTAAGYTVTDMESANGTYVNGKRLQSGQAQQISNNDIIRLANSDFCVIMK